MTKHTELADGRRADNVRDVNLSDRQFRSLRAMIDDGGYTKRDIERRFGHSMAWLRDRLREWEGKRE